MKENTDLNKLFCKRKQSKGGKTCVFCRQIFAQIVQHDVKYAITNSKGSISHFPFPHVLFPQYFVTRKKNTIMGTKQPS